MTDKGSPAADGQESSLKLMVTFNCTSDGSSETRKLELSPFPRTVADIKEHIQSKCSIPKCMQKISLHDHLLNNSQEVSALYVRSEDPLTITYLAQASVEPMKKFIHIFLHPLLTILETNPEILKNPSTEIAGLMHYCEVGFHHTAFSFLLPWESPATEANRQLLIQEGGLDFILQLYFRLQQMPWDRRHTHLQTLEVSCLHVLWNFAETVYARQLVVEKGGFEMMVSSLLYCSNEDFLKKYQMHGIFDTAVGCISNYCELECCQLPLVKNKPAMDRLLTFALRGSSLNIFTKMLIANCLFRASHTLQTHRLLTSPSLLQPMLDFYYRYPGSLSYAPNLAMRYMICMTLARLLLFSVDAIHEDYLPKILSCMDLFLTNARSRDITRMEEKYHYNWITMLPFVEMFYLPVSDTAKEQPCTLEGEESLRDKCQHWSMSVAVVGIEAEMARGCNRKVTINQGLLDFVVCLPWGMPAKWGDGCRAVVALFRKEGKLPVPKLSSIAKATLSRTTDGLRKYL